ncbi:MAG TPA: hypothetical protein VF171_00905 [Trueperaceae bacterium]
MFEIFMNSLMMMAILGGLAALFGFVAHALVQQEGAGAAEPHE